ncbi:5'-nucleotidase domain-containing protein isoform X1 [Gossypium australe]|uniref:5'-nucleotidase domain-containing protein isoform X1 n=1 Tax=Gossypium australe TaxID=47621 RepID=A0A5B6XAA3_9ROSI|nr:5'-nucleotidase domain-containing protein isoform X1 [Gossypium australe]
MEEFNCYQVRRVSREEWRNQNNSQFVIYFGDHLFSDLRGPSKAGWRTAAIIHELEDEIRIQNEDHYRFEQAKFHILQELLGRLHAVIPSSKRSEAYKLLMGELNEERQKARSMMKRMFNTSFGATFLTDKGQESAFAYHIHQYADVYTSKPENFLFYSPETWLHAPCDIKIMPHHVKKLSTSSYGGSLNHVPGFHLVCSKPVDVPRCRKKIGGPFCSSSKSGKIIDVSVITDDHGIMLYVP